MRETKMLEEFLHLLVEENLLPKNQKERDLFHTETGRDWVFGRVKFFINDAKDGWDVRAEALEPSEYMVRSGWGDLLGIYELKIDKNQSLLSYKRK